MADEEDGTEHKLSGTVSGTAAFVAGGSSSIGRALVRSNMESLFIREAERQLERLAKQGDQEAPPSWEEESTALATAVVCAHIALEARVNRILVDKLGVMWADDPSIVNEGNKEAKKKLESESIEKQHFGEKWKRVRKHFYELDNPTDIYTLALFRSRRSPVFEKEKMGIAVLSALRDILAHYKGDKGEPFRDRVLVRTLVSEARELIDHTDTATWINR